MIADYPHSATLQDQAYEDGPMLRVYPWGRGHRVQWHYVGCPDERREESLTQFRRLFIKENQ